MNFNNKYPDELLLILDDLHSYQIQEIFSYKPTNDIRGDYIFNLGGKTTGCSTFLYDSFSNQSYFSWFYPLALTPYLKSENVKKQLNRETGFGLGTLAHVMSILDPDNFIDGVVDSFVNTFGSDREGHLRAMNIPNDDLVPFREYALRSVDYANNKGFNFDLSF